MMQPGSQRLWGKASFAKRGSLDYDRLAELRRTDRLVLYRAIDTEYFR